VNVLNQAGDTRPVITQTLGDAWGLHLYDFNIDLGNLVTLVHDEAAVYSRHSFTADIGPGRPYNEEIPNLPAPDRRGDPGWFSSPALVRGPSHFADG